MAYKTIMAHLGLAQSNSELLRVAGHLAKQSGAILVGVAACQPVQFAYTDGYVSGEIINDCQAELEGELRGAETEFRQNLQGKGASLKWRSRYTTGALPDYLASEARCADLVVTSTVTSGAIDASRHSSIGDLVMRAGRPVLVVPAKGAKIPFERIVVAWKDTREARRAVVDALPLLALAKQVTVVEIAPQDELPLAQARVRDVADWLSGHGIAAATIATLSRGHDANRLDAILAEHDTDLVVAGAYGHNRLREWAFGGVTDNLLHGGRCALLSH